MGDKDKKIERVKAILANHNIIMNVVVCGCCGSPEVTFIHEGEIIFDGEENVNIRMISYDDLDALVVGQQSIEGNGGAAASGRKGAAQLIASGL